MHIYFIGIGGVGLGPLAEIATQAGHQVSGSDSSASLMTEQLAEHGITVSHDQTGLNLQQVHDKSQIDWVVWTAGLPSDHPERALASKLGIRQTKRDELLSYIIDKSGQKLIAVSGTHGKTTTTAMMVWVFSQLAIPVSYSIGSEVNFGPSGQFDQTAEYFIYECDEFDRNFLQFQPFLALIPSIGYDHPDTFPTTADYQAAFEQFIGQSEQAIAWRADLERSQLPLTDNIIALPPSAVEALDIIGAHNRSNGTLVAEACELLQVADFTEVGPLLEQFPGSARRLEELADGLYSDYGHHPVEISATLEAARELSDRVVLVYQPHQNIRQHHILEQYTDCMELAETIYWLPTFLTREDPDLEILSPEQLTAHLTNRDNVRFADLNDELWQKIQHERDSGALVLVMGAGTIDDWVRSQLKS